MASREDFLKKCQRHLQGSSIPRQWHSSRLKERSLPSDEIIRVQHWNSLAQALSQDNFVKCPPEALEWKTRKFRILEELLLYNADIICLEEVDYFEFVHKSLIAVGYEGHFFPKPNSPCLKLPNHSGPDGSAIFYKRDKFELVKLDRYCFRMANLTRWPCQQR